jgi:sulfur-carrier protein
MPVLVRIPTPLRRHTGGAGEVHTQATDVAGLVADLERQFPGMRERLCDETGDFRKFINVYVNQEDVRFLQGLDSQLKDGDEVAIVPAIAGGR